MKIAEQVGVSSAQLIPVIREVLAANGTFDLTVTGSSMLPTLKHLKSSVRLLDPSVREPKPYDIVLFERSEGICVLHRIVKRMEGGRFLINGDAQNWTETIDRRQIIGVVSELKRTRRWISCDALWYRAYGKLWAEMKLLRRIYFFMWRFARHFRHHMM